MAKLEGIRNLRKFLKDAQKRHLKNLGRGLYMAGLHLLSVALPITPHEWGDLRRSGRVRKDGTDIAPEVYVEFTQSYAIYVHEILEYKHDPPTQAKFLEQPARQERGTMLQIIKEETGKG